MKLNNNDRILFEVAQKNAQTGDITAAIQQLIDLIHKYPNNGLLHAVLANNYWDIGNLHDADYEFIQGIKLDPNNEQCSLGLFHFLWEQNKQVEALEEVKRFLSLSKSSEYDEIIKAINKAADEY